LHFDDTKRLIKVLNRLVEKATRFMWLSITWMSSKAVITWWIWVLKAVCGWRRIAC
jgi:hypothetical protein